MNGDLLRWRDHYLTEKRGRMLGVVAGSGEDLVGRRFYKVAWNNGETYLVWNEDLEVIQ